MKMVLNDKSTHSIGHLIAKPFYYHHASISLNAPSKNERNLNEPSNCFALCASCFAYNKFGILH